jgi:DNA-binding protein HU-beta
MNKSELIDKVAERAGMSRAAAARAVDAIFDTAGGAISEAVHGLGELSIPGFGKFSKRTLAARAGRNPRTGAAIDIPERVTIGFTSAPKLREGASGGRPTGTPKYRTIKKAHDTGGLDRESVRDAVLHASGSKAAVRGRQSVRARRASRSM